MSVIDGFTSRQVSIQYSTTEFISFLPFSLSVIIFQSCDIQNCVTLYIQVCLQLWMVESNSQTDEKYSE